MDTSINNSKAFLDSIKKLSEEECEKINNETDEIKAQRLDSFNKEAQSNCAEYVKYELSRIKSEKNRAISAAEEESKLNLCKIRQELTDKVFESVRSELIAYTESDEYQKLLVSFVKEIYEQTSEKDELEFFVRSKDMEFKEEINDTIRKFIHISATDDILIGGIKALNHKTGCLYDNTLDLKAEEQKAWFFENSGLKI